MTEKAKTKHLISLYGNKEDIDAIKQFCDDEGLYMGRFLVRCAIHHIEEIQRDRLDKQLERYKKDHEP